MGIDAEATPPSDSRTSELGACHTNGEECYPLQVTVGDFVKILEQPGGDPNNVAFFMATGQGPCRFGQYEPYMKSKLASLGYSGVTILAPSCETGYSDFGEISNLYARYAWRALVSADILLKLLLKTRPYETISGSADTAYEECLDDLCRTLEVTYQTDRQQMKAILRTLTRVRDRFRAVETKFDPDRPLIGVVGEIFCRLNDFSNRELVRRLEDAGAEVWMNDVAEWIWYTNEDQFRVLKLRGRQFSLEALSAYIRNHIQHKDEHALQQLFREDFRGYEEPERIQVVLNHAEPFLPWYGANGEMVLNVGKAVYFAHKGVDGVIDISPFTCMNGIVGEALYPRVSRENCGIPIRNFYFDGTHADLDRDIDIFVELAKSYQQRKPWPRQMPAIAGVAAAA
jgi:predicted nucleotide-binding protein (sugar kinase/HSP70/actin superfamily)